MTDRANPTEERVAQVEALAARAARDAAERRRMEAERLELEKQRELRTIVEALRASGRDWTKPDPEPTASPAGLVRTDGGRSVAYVNERNQVFNKNRGEWQDHDQKWWRRFERQGTDRVFVVKEVLDGPTLTVDGKIRRGCVVCGLAAVVAQWLQFDGLHGRLCAPCHMRWDRLTPAERSPEVFVTTRLKEAGFLPGVDLVRENDDYQDVLVLDDWRTRTWGHRVMAAADPHRQEPMTTAFGYLAGPITVKEEDE